MTTAVAPAASPFVPPLPEGQEGLLEGLCRVLANPAAQPSARLQALHHINALSTHSDPTRNSVTALVMLPLVQALGDPDPNLHCEAASAVGNLVHGSPVRAAQLMDANVVWPLMNLLRERHATTLSRAALALGALRRASPTCRQQLEVAGRETLLPLMLSPHASVCDAAEYAILGLYGGPSDDPAQAMALRAQVAALRASKESFLPHPSHMQVVTVPPTYATPAVLPTQYEYAVLHVEGDGGCEHVHASAADAQAAEASDVKMERKTIRADEYARLVAGWMLSTAAPGAAEALAEPPKESGSTQRGSPSGA